MRPTSCSRRWTRLCDASTCPMRGVLFWNSHAFNLTSDVRPMSQHSEYVTNLQLGFDSDNGAHTFTLAYNTFGERLFFAGRDGSPDAYEQPFNSLDFVYSFYPTDRLSMKFRFQNLLDEKLEIEQRGVTVIEQSLGTTAKLDVEWKLGN